MKSSKFILLKTNYRVGDILELVDFDYGAEGSLSQGESEVFAEVWLMIGLPSQYQALPIFCWDKYIQL